MAEKEFLDRHSRERERLVTRADLMVPQQAVRWSPSWRRKKVVSRSERESEG